MANKDINTPLWAGAPADPDFTYRRAGLTPSAKRVRVLFGGETVADTTHAILLREPETTPIYYFPRTDVRMDLLAPSGDHGHSPTLGEAVYWSLAVGGRRQKNAAWSYEDPGDGRRDIKNHLAFFWNRIDRWLEEDEEIFVHPRDPFVRIDVLDSRRDVRIVVGGEPVARSTRARFLFETGLPIRYYLPREDVRWDLLAPSGTSSACPYKGEARYWSVRAGGEVWPDIVWSYSDPLPECGRIKDYLCFYNEMVDGIFVDGEVVEKPRMRKNWL